MAIDPAVFSRAVSDDAAKIVDFIKTKYTESNQENAAIAYSRHLKKFFQWAESKGYPLTSLPAGSAEEYLAEKGDKDTTTHVARTQLRIAMKAAQEGLGANFSHIEYQSGRAPAVHKMEKEREKRKRQADNAAASGQVVKIPEKFAKPEEDAPVEYMDTGTETPQSTRTQAVAPGVSVSQGTQGAPTIVIQQGPATPASGSGRINTIGNQMNGINTGAKPGQPPARSVVISSHSFSGPYVKIMRVADGTEPLVPMGTEMYVTTIPTAQLAAHGDVAGYLQNFTIRQMRLSPLTSQVNFVFYELNDRKQPTGRRDEMIVACPPLDGGMNGYSMNQQIPQQLSSLSPAGAPVVVQVEQAPQMTPMSTPVAAIAPPPVYSQREEKFDKATEFLLQKLDRESEDAKKRAEALEMKLAEARDTQTTFLLTQQMRQEQELRAKLEEQKREASDKIEREKAEETRRQEREEFRRMMEMQAQAQRPTYSEPPPWMMQPPPPPPVVEHKSDASAEMAKAFAESQAKMMEAMMNGLAAARNVPPPPPPPPQKDVAEWMVPMMTQMAQLQQSQAQQQAQMQQAQQQMMMQMQAENMKMVIAMQQTQAQMAQASSDKMMQLMLANSGKEDAGTAVLKEQLRQAQQQIAGLSQRGDDVEEFAEKFAKMKQLNEMMGGGGGGGGQRDIISAVMENADTIGAGVAKMLQAYGAAKVMATPQQAAPAGPPPGGYPPVMGLPGMAPPPQLAGAPAEDPRMAQARAMMDEATAMPEPEQKPMNPPERSVAALDTIAKTDDEETIVNAFIEYLKAMNDSEFPLFQKQLERILQAFQEADEREDIYTLCKHLWIALNMKPDKAAAKKLAIVVTKWYPLIHKSFFGTSRMLPDEEVMPDVKQALAVAEGQGGGDEEDGDEDEDEEDDDEEDGD